MAAILAHQIRNPLGSVVTAGATISMGGLSVQEGKELRDVLEHESRRLNQFLENFLRFTRLQKLQLTEADLNQEMEVVLEAMQPDPSFQRDSPASSGSGPEKS
jgi:signal transduction histidine kinase